MADDRKPQPPIRATLVDQGWSAPPPKPAPVEGLPIPEVPAAAPVAQVAAFAPVPGPLSATPLMPLGLPPREEGAPPEAVPAPPAFGAVPAQAAPVGLAAGPRPAPTRQVAPEGFVASSELSRTPVQSLAAVMRSRVLVGATSAPLWSVFSAAVGLAAAGAFVVALAIGVWVTSSSRFSRFAPAPVPEVGMTEPLPPAVGGVEVPPSVDRAEQLRQLVSTQKGDHSVEQALALAESSLKVELVSAEALARRFDDNPGLVRDPELLKQYRALASREATAIVIQRSMARLPGEAAADLLYDVWTGTSERSPATALAETLVYSKEVFPRASKALKVALELRRADACEEYHAILGDAVSHGDRRSLHLLAALQRKFGCGPKQKSDCYACLRTGKELEEAIKAVRGRRAPAF
jgi:hypothetical protein